MSESQPPLAQGSHNRAAEPVSRNHLETIASAAAISSGVVVMGISVITLVEIIARKWLQFSIQGVDEINGYLFATTATLSFTTALIRNAHIRIDIGYRFFHKKWRALVNWLSTLTLTLASWLLLISASVTWWASWNFNTVSISALSVPLILPQAVWCVLLLMLTLVATFMACRATCRLFRQDWEGVEKLCGIPATDEAIAAETRAFASRKEKAQE